MLPVVQLAKSCPCPFLKIEKSALIVGKNTQIVSIYRLNFLFKMQFYEYLGKKT